jgi:hypothetical protein
MTTEEILKSGLSQMTEKNTALQIEIMVLQSTIESLTQILRASGKTSELIEA